MKGFSPVFLHSFFFLFPKIKHFCNHQTRKHLIKLYWKKWNVDFHVKKQKQLFCWLPKFLLNIIHAIFDGWHFAKYSYNQKSNTIWILMKLLLYYVFWMCSIICLSGARRIFNRPFRVYKIFWNLFFSTQNPFFDDELFKIKFGIYSGIVF